MGDVVRCLQCGKDWPTDLAICPADGGSLTSPLGATAMDTALTHGTMVGEYRIEKLIGRGAMGWVYGAVHPVIGKKVAIKIIADELCAVPGSVARFVQEARAAAQLGHPNIVDAFAFGTLPGGHAYFVMEWLRGQTLLDRLLRGRVDLHEGLEIVDQVCAGL